MATESLSEMVVERVSAAITQADRTRSWVAKQAGIPATTFARKISGHTEFTVADLSRIAKALNVEPSALFPRTITADRRAA